MLRAHRVCRVLARASVRAMTGKYDRERWITVRLNNEEFDAIAGAVKMESYACMSRAAKRSLQRACETLYTARTESAKRTNHPEWMEE